ncbi:MULTISPECIES: sugar transferase [Cytobacillus]|uniref:Sugar transferase n=1 Tax=Cytobacillus kochii TaxID=859143 RepID=A0A248TJZ0_9BACI|nr:sugar transferase [Cytobacillus kochii]ASV68534.1 sugar transferase [Cytobacillus kochii]MDQ0187216.1 sugar transferase EpsL [Cytobacillus kochii]MED1604059.1 sugar transferase [Cytobacillus kochii]
MKRLFDFISACILLLLFAPVMAIISTVLLINGSCIFFRQERPGLNGSSFRLYKFCTMTDETNEQGHLLPDEKRLTKIGSKLRKYSLDELPQLLNVLKGEMSLVGPRPLLIDYLPLYSPEQARRHCVKPGITGWAQVNGRNAISWEEKLKMDVWYVDHQHFLLDLKILFLTISKVIRSEGINQPGAATTEVFKGSQIKMKE